MSLSLLEATKTSRVQKRDVDVRVAAINIQSRVPYALVEIVVVCVRVVHHSGIEAGQGAVVLDGMGSIECVEVEFGAPGALLCLGQLCSLVTGAYLILGPLNAPDSTHFGHLLR